MNRGIYGLLNVCFRQVVAIFLVATTFLAIPAFSYGQGVQAQAGTLLAKAGSPILDRDTAERVLESAEDRVGDQPIGDTGLKNIKQLGENIPQAGDLVVRQRSGIDKPGTPEAKATSDRLKAESKE